MTATDYPTPILGMMRSSRPLRIPSAPLGSSPTAVLDPLSGRITRGLTDQPYWSASPGATSLGGQVQPTPVSALWLMAAGRDCLRTSHVGRLMMEAARLRTVSEADPAGQTAWGLRRRPRSPRSGRAPADPGRIRSADGAVRAVGTVVAPRPQPAEEGPTHP